MKKIFSLITLLLFSCTMAYVSNAKPDDTKNGEYSLEKTHASLIWKVNHMGLSNYTARFTDFDAKLVWDPKDLSKSSVSATINPASVRTDYPNSKEVNFDEKLAKGKEWFNSDAFPQIKFRSTSIVKTEDNKAEVIGDLTFLGVTKPVTLHVKFNGGIKKHPFYKTSMLGFSATAKFKRSDFGMSSYIPTIGDEIEILIEAEFVKSQPAS